MSTFKNLLNYVNMCPKKTHAAIGSTKKGYKTVK